ncbi:MAG: Veg family protein [Bacillota bacterium]
MKKNTTTISNVKTFLGAQTGEINIRVHLGRNKFENHHGVIASIFPAVFTFQTPEKLKTFSYSQVLCGDVKFKK